MNINLLIAIIGGVLFVIVGGYLMIKVVPVMYNYRVTRFGVEIFIFRFFPIYKIAIDKIKNVDLEEGLTSLRGYNFNPFRTLRLPNRFTRIYLVIEKEGVIKYLIITPPNAELFYTDLKAVWSADQADRAGFGQ